MNTMGMLRILSTLEGRDNNQRMLDQGILLWEVFQQQMDQIFFCIHEKCNAKERLLMTMADVPKHNDKNHRVIQFQELKAFVNQKFNDADISKMQRITAQEQQVRDNITKQLKEVKDKLDMFELNEIKKMPSLQKLLDYVQLVKKTVNLKDISNELLVGVVEFQVERIPKYATVLGSLDERIGQIKTEILNMLKAHSHDLTIAPLNLVKFSWSEAFKANIYAIREDKKEIEPTSAFLGWSFACTQQLMGSNKRHEIKLDLIEVEQKPLNISQVPGQDKGKQKYSFAVGITQSKIRQQKGFDQQDLSVVGHGFYVLRDLCHHSDKAINWKPAVAFTPELGVLQLRFDPSEAELLIEQGKNKQKMKVDKLQNDGFLFCVHLKGCKARIVDS